MIGYRTHQRKILLGATASSYLVLAIALGPDRAFFFIGACLLIYSYYMLCRSYPDTVGYYTGWILSAIFVSFFWGLISGLLGLRTYSYARPYYRRRRR